MNVNLHIERLVLEGIAVEPAHRPALQAALQAELGRLLAQGGVSPSLAAGGAMQSLRAGGFQMSAERHPTRLGRQIARAVYGGLAR